MCAAVTTRGKIIHKQSDLRSCVSLPVPVNVPALNTLRWRRRSAWKGTTTHSLYI